MCKVDLKVILISLATFLFILNVYFNLILKWEESLPDVERGVNSPLLPASNRRRLTSNDENTVTASNIIDEKTKKINAQIVVLQSEANYLADQIAAFLARNEAAARAIAADDNTETTVCGKYAEDGVTEDSCGNYVSPAPVASPVSKFIHGVHESSDESDNYDSDSTELFSLDDDETATLYSDGIDNPGYLETEPSEILPHDYDDAEGDRDADKCYACECRDVCKCHANAPCDKFPFWNKGDADAVADDDAADGDADDEEEDDNDGKWDTKVTRDEGDNYETAEGEDDPETGEEYDIPEDDNDDYNFDYYGDYGSTFG